jgi:hypothetical protein
MSSQTNDYRRNMAECMSYLDKVDYNKFHVHRRERLEAITPAHLLTWMNFKAYRTETPGKDDHPMFARHTAIQYGKKAVSSFMPHRLQAWDEIRQYGNPTRAPEINALISEIKREECRGLGKPTKACRPCTFDEMKQQQLVLRESPENVAMMRFGMPACSNFQVHMLARIDCCTQWQKKHFKPHTKYPEFAAQTRLAWSKNVNCESEAPWQIMLGSHDPNFCVFVGLAIWLEYYIGAHPTYLSPYVFDFSGDFRRPHGGKKANKLVQTKLKLVYAGEIGVGFERDPEAEGNLGSHSIRKYGSTRTRRAGIVKDEKDHRGRWKTDSRTSDVYDDVMLPYPDAKVAATLCKGGACSYRIRANSPVTDDWILQNVVPKIAASCYGTTLAKLLGKALLWTIMSNKRHWVHDPIVERVRAAYSILLGQPEEEEFFQNNPIEKFSLEVTGDDAILVITELGNEDPEGQVAGGGGGGGVAPIGTRTDRQLLNTLLQQVNTMNMTFNAAVGNLLERQEADRKLMMTQFRINAANVRRIAIQPARPLQRAAQPQSNNLIGCAPAAAATATADSNSVAAGGFLPSPPLAELSPTPRSLYVLWQEWVHGISGRKPASQFTAKERGGASKHKYHRRLKIWKRISLLVNAGIDSTTACDRMYDVYGPSLSVSKIINALDKDTKNGTLHSLLTV